MNQILNPIQHRIMRAAGHACLALAWLALMASFVVLALGVVFNTDWLP